MRAIWKEGHCVTSKQNWVSGKRSFNQNYKGLAGEQYLQYVGECMEGCGDTDDLVTV